MRFRPFLVVTVLLAAAAVAVPSIDWGFNALRLYMAASQPLEVGDAPHRESVDGVAFSAIAINGEGVIETLNAAAKLVIQDFIDKH